MRNTFVCTLCTLLCATAAFADEVDRRSMHAMATESSHWQQTSAAMPSDTYFRTVQRNRDIVRQQLELYTDRLAGAAGTYGQAVSVVGAAVALAATDQRYNLTDNKAVGVVLRDTTSNDRMVLLEYRKAW